MLLDSHHGMALGSSYSRPLISFLGVKKYKELEGVGVSEGIIMHLGQDGTQYHCASTQSLIIATRAKQCKRHH